MFSCWVSGRYWGQSLQPQNETEKEEEKRGFNRNGFNQFISDRLPLDREVPDTRDPRCEGVWGVRVCSV